MTKARKLPPRRKGLILLVVLGMLTLFTLLAVTFVVFSSQSVQASRAYERPKQRMTPPDRLADMVLKQIVRGTKDESSPFYDHDLLQDVYGKSYRYNTTTGVIEEQTIIAGTRFPATGFDAKRGFRLKDNNATVTRATSLASNGLIKVTLRFGTPVLNDDSLNTRVLTVLNGDLAGNSYRILRQRGTQVLIDLYEPFHYTANAASRDLVESILVDNTLLQNAFRDKILLFNATAYNGLGLGYANINRNSQTLSTLNHPSNSALQGITATGLKLPFVGNLGVARHSLNVAAFDGSTAEDYDAADFNDWWLSYIYEMPTDAEDVIPSFHRPAVIRKLYEEYKASGSSNAEQFVKLIAAITPRPISANTASLKLNPYFTGGNPGTTFTGDLDSFINALTKGDLDVDTDGDGIKDSVWLDPNLPLITSQNGKLLKPLVVVSITDQESRLNLNATADRLQSKETEYLVGSGTDAAFANTAQPAIGNGLGPADLSLAHIFKPNPPVNAGFKDIFDSRYGRDQAPGRIGAEDTSYVNSRQTLAKHRHYPFGPGLPLNTHGRIAVGVDVLGNPRLRWNDISVSGNSLTDEVGIADPYKATGGITPNAGDNYFSFTELEAVLRKYDADRETLPGRVSKLLSDDFVNASVVGELSRIVGVSGVDVTLPPLVGRADRNAAVLADPVSYEYREFANLQEMLLNMIAIQRKKFPALTPSVGQPAAYRIEDFRMSFPAEISLNRKFDINMPLGNGKDDNSNGAIDEPLEVANQPANNFNDRESYPGVSTPIEGDYASDKIQGTFNGVPANANNFKESLTGSAALRAGLNLQEQGPYITRELMARYLYCLAQAIVPAEYPFPGMSGVTAQGKVPTPLTIPNLKIRSKQLAQWAVNVVDYRDSDSSMTRFAYDENPFRHEDGQTEAWTPGQNCIVWGMEFPELVFSEVLATHDVGVQDTYLDSTRKTMRDPTTPDPHSDQYVIPTGSLFVEVYAPRSSGPEADSYLPGMPVGTTTTNGTRTGVHISATTPPSTGAPLGMPVWRIAISPTLADATGPIPGANSTAAPHIALLNGLRSGNTTDERWRWQNQPTRNTAPAGNAIKRHRNGLLPQFDGNQTGTIATPGTQTADMVIDRMIWFSKFNPATAAAGSYNLNAVPEFNLGTPIDRIYYNRSGTDFVEGGGYLVIGPRPSTSFGSENPGAAYNTEIFGNTAATQATPLKDLIKYLPAKQKVSFGANGVDTLQIDGTSRNPANIRGASWMVAASNPRNTANWNTAFPNGIGINISLPSADQLINTAVHGYRAPTLVLNSNSAANFPTVPNSWTNVNVSPIATTLPDAPFDIQNPILKIPATDFARGASQGQRTINDARILYLQRIADPQRPFDPKLNPYITVDVAPTDLSILSGEYAADATNIAFGSTQRSGKSVASTEGDSILSPFTFDMVKPPLSQATTVVDKTIFRYQLGQAATVAASKAPSLGHLNIGYGAPQAAIVTDNDATSFLGRPPQAMGGLFWLNRDFATPHELMLVPVSSPGQLHQQYANWHLPTGVTSPYGLSKATTRNHHYPFGHLFNYFEGSVPNHGNSTAEDTEVGLDLFRIFDFIETPSRFAGVQRILPFKSLEGTGTDPLLEAFQPPYNRVHTYREPGKINLNTVASEFVWKALEGNYFSADRQTTSSTWWTKFKESRQGYTPSTGFKHLSVDFPSQFAGVYRRNRFGGFVPFDSIYVQDNQEKSVNSSLIRPEFDTAAKKPGNISLIANPQNTNDPFLKLQPMLRLPNLVSTQSNVLVVRMTIGYFEYSPSTGLGREHVSNHGEVERHRMLYVIDRSIPVGYVTGEDVNIERTILLRRVLD